MCTDGGPSRGLRFLNPARPLYPRFQNPMLTVIIFISSFTGLFIGSAHFAGWQPGRRQEQVGGPIAQPYEQTQRIHSASQRHHCSGRILNFIASRFWLTSVLPTELWKMTPPDLRRHSRIYRPLSISRLHIPLFLFDYY